MPKLKIENLLGVKRAEIDLDGIVEVVGPNASGKSSLAACAQALLAHEQNPLGVPATQAARVYLHDGEDEGLAEIEGVEWRPGKGLTVTDGAVALSRPEAVGLVDYTARRGEKERLESLQSALLPAVSEILDAVRNRLLEYMPAHDVNGLMEIVGERGFDAAKDIYVDRGKKAKKQWREITGMNYGTRVAPDWRPDGWLADMDAMTVQQAEEAVTATREALAALGRVQAVTEAEAHSAGEARDALPGLKAVLKIADDKTQAIRANLEGMALSASASAVKEAEQELAEKRALMHVTPHLSCPHCQRGVVLVGDGTLERYNAVVSRQAREWAEAEAVEIEGVLAERIREHEAAQRTAQGRAEHLRTAEHETGEAMTAVAVAEKLARNAGAEVDTADRRADLMQAEQAVDDAKRRVGMVSAEARAAELSETIARYTEIGSALGPQGVRSKMMEAGLRKLNQGLAVIGGVTDWPSIEVGDKGAVVWGGRPIQLCSASEQWRAQAAIQLTLAAMTGSQAVVLDRADLLDPRNREGLVRAVQRVSGKTGIAVLLCSTGAVNGDAPWKQVGFIAGKLLSVAYFYLVHEGGTTSMIARLFCLVGFHSVYRVYSMWKADCYFACRRCGWRRGVYQR